VAHEVAEFVQDQRLDEIVVCAEPESLDGSGDFGVARHDYHFNGRVVALDFAEEFNAVHFRHADVAEGGVEELGF
jgi:hypothetical protein